MGFQKTCLGADSIGRSLGSLRGGEGAPWDLLTLWDLSLKETPGAGRQAEQLGGSPCVMGSGRRCLTSL